MDSPTRSAPTDQVVVNLIYHIEEELACAAVMIRHHDTGAIKDNKLVKIVPWVWQGGKNGGVAKVTLMLTVDEKTTIAPGLSASAFRPNNVTVFKSGNIVTSQQFSLGIGASGSVDANRQITTDYTFSIVDDLLSWKPAGGGFDTASNCDEETGAVKEPRVGAMIEGDLKIADSFYDLVIPYLARGAGKPITQTEPPDTLQTTIIFTLNGSGTASPFWKLVPVSYGSSSTPFLTAARNSTDEVIVTFGPAGSATSTAHNITKANSGAAAVGASGP